MGSIKYDHKVLKESPGPWFLDIKNKILLYLTIRMLLLKNYIIKHMITAYAFNGNFKMRVPKDFKRL